MFRPLGELRCLQTPYSRENRKGMGKRRGGRKGSI